MAAHVHKDVHGLRQGRLIDHLRNTQSVGLEDLQALVLDEADRLLQMGFSEEVSSPWHLTFD
jgi:ATP-dependent RNA helicase DDX27